MDNNSIYKNRMECTLDAFKSILNLYAKQPKNNVATITFKAKDSTESEFQALISMTHNAIKPLNSDFIQFSISQDGTGKVKFDLIDCSISNKDQNRVAKNGFEFLVNNKKKHIDLLILEKDPFKKLESQIALKVIDRILKERLV